MTGLEMPTEVEFRIAHFWVKAYDVPGEKQTISFAQVLASNIGTFVSCGEATMFAGRQSPLFLSGHRYQKAAEKRHLHQNCRQAIVD